MKYNQYSYLSVDQKILLRNQKKFGLDLPHPPSQKKNFSFEWFVRKVSASLL